MARTARGSATRPTVPLIQDRPADPPNPAAPVRAGREEPTERRYEVIGPRRVGGAVRGETVTLSLTDTAEAALIRAGHVKPAPEAKQEKQDRPSMVKSETQEPETQKEQD